MPSEIGDRITHDELNVHGGDAKEGTEKEKLKTALQKRLEQMDDGESDLFERPGTNNLSSDGD